MLSSLIPDLQLLHSYLLWFALFLRNYPHIPPLRDITCQCHLIKQHGNSEGKFLNDNFPITQPPSALLRSHSNEPRSRQEQAQRWLLGVLFALSRVAAELFVEMKQTHKVEKLPSPPSHRDPLAPSLSAHYYVFHLE